MDHDDVILLMNGFCVIITLYCFSVECYIIALIGVVINFTLSFYEPIFGRYFFSKGIKAKNNGDFENAIKYFNKGMYIKPSFLGFAFNLGKVYADLKDYEKSIEYFDKVIEKEDDEFAYINNFVSSYYLGNYYSARMYLERYKLINPDARWVKINKLKMLSRFKGYSLKLKCLNYKGVCEFNVGGFNAKYKFKEDVYEERMDYFRVFKKWSRRR